MNTPQPKQVTMADIEQNTQQTMVAIDRIRRAFIEDTAAGKPTLCQLVQETLVQMPWVIPVVNILPGISIVTARGQFSVNFSQQMYDEDVQELKHRMAAHQEGRLFV